MKSSAAGVATAAAIGLAALTAAPAAAAPGDPMVFTDCATAHQYGVYNIPVGSVSYSTSLVDDDGDGIVCESAEWSYDPTRIPVENESGGYSHTIIDWIPGAGPGPDAQPGEVPGADPYTQVGEVPVGGADTGAAVDVGSGASGPALAGGLVLVAGGAAVAVRRRRAHRA
ncbi:excalibur calcium-binding domain-containing protein [uncultured Kocuria sp.]|uniref:excalibur calcium-binding domain-containing protein n=1 Tax=uncultured Kocuria sp. TaxID=259305 RepID=UPI00261BAC27|nr:excalibur calcium-binding domain-containing protein [uncultured Kocuria sp.]